MIRLKKEINRAQTMRDLHKKATKKYKNTPGKEMYIAGFMYGAYALFDLLHLPFVSNSVCLKTKCWHNKNNCCKNTPEQFDSCLYKAN